MAGKLNTSFLAELDDGPNCYNLQQNFVQAWTVGAMEEGWRFLSVVKTRS